METKNNITVGMIVTSKFNPLFRGEVIERLCVPGTTWESARVRIKPARGAAVVELDRNLIPIAENK